MADVSTKPNGSLPEPDPTQTLVLLSRSRELLAKAWDNPSEVGLESRLLGECQHHLDSVRQYRSPKDDEEEARSKFIEALRIAWFATWLARDYSIKGWQARVDPSPTGILNSLHRNQGLVDVANRYWLECHKPLFDRDGKPSNETRSELAPIFNAPGAAQFLEGAQVGSPRFLQNVWQQIAKGNLQWAYVAEGCGVAVPSEWILDNSFCETLEGNQLPRKNSLRHAILIGYGRFNELSSLDGFNGARFESGAEIAPLSDSSSELLPPNLYCARKLLIDRGTISSPIIIRGWPGVELVETQLVNFKNDVRFVGGGHAIGWIFAGGEIEGAVSANDTSFSSFQMRGTVLRKPSTFVACRFAKPPTLRACNFAGGAYFEECHFGHEQPGVTEFNDTHFDHLLRVSGGSFGQGANSVTSFAQATIERAQFEGVEFNCRLAFGAKLRGNVIFKPSKTAISCFRFDADFRVAGPISGAFSIVAARFLGDADFRNVTFADTTEFDESFFVRPPRFFGATLHPDTSFRGVVFDWKSQLTASILSRSILARLGKIGGSNFFPRSLAQVRNDDLYLGRVERAFSALREHANKIQAKPLAAEFHKQELEARRLRVFDRGVPGSETLASWLYRTFSDYGDSFSRPLGWLFVSWAAWTVAYWCLAGWHEDNLPAAAAISLAATLKPWAALDPTIARAASEWTGHCKDMADSQRILGLWIPQTDYCLAVQLTHEKGWLFRITGVVQSIVSVVLIFLMLLGIRRKFQLS